MIFGRELVWADGSLAIVAARLTGSVLSMVDMDVSLIDMAFLPSSMIGELEWLVSYGIILNFG